MTEFQKIMTGILGLTHPEMFISNPKSKQAPAGKIATGRDSIEPRRRRGGQVTRAIRAIRFTLAALAIGSRAVGLADNSRLRRDLSARARLLYGPGEC